MEHSETSACIALFPSLIKTQALSNVVNLRQLKRLFFMDIFQKLANLSAFTDRLASFYSDIIQ
ncbi:MAG: hypothetical protein AAFZ92_09955 [Pseudomonadota bacterium]